MPAALRWILRLVPTNPIVVRLVQGGSRRSRHNLIRTAYLATLMVVLLILLFPSSGQTVSFQELARDGAFAFEMVAYLQIALICILSPVFMAGAIAQESNPRTWEVMLTTPLSALQMVLGHLFGRLFFILALLFASLPFFALTQYFGGVPGRTILLSYLVAAGAALLVGSIAVMLAVSRLAGRRAVFAFYVSVVTYLAVTIAIDRGIGAGGVTIVTPLNPFLALYSLLNPTGYPRPELFELAQMPWYERLWFGDPVTSWVLVTVIISLLLIITGTLMVRRVGSTGGTPWYRRLFGLASRGAGHRAPRNVWTNPIAWREAAARQATLPKLAARWMFIALGVLWGLGLILLFHVGRLTPVSFRFALLVTVWTELIVIALVAINVSATAISREREDGTLDLLLTTPITPGEYLGGKLRGVISYLMPLLLVPLGTVVLVGLYMLAGGLGRAGGITTTSTFGVVVVSHPIILPEAALLLPIVTLPFMAFCIMIGLQWSMKSKGTIASVIATVGVVGVVAGLVGLCGWQIGRTVDLIGPAASGLTPLTLMLATGDPQNAYSNSVTSASAFDSARWTLGFGAMLALLGYSFLVFGIRSNMVRTFDMAVRKLAGTS